MRIKRATYGAVYAAILAASTQVIKGAARIDSDPMAAVDRGRSPDVTLTDWARTTAMCILEESLPDDYRGKLRSVASKQIDLAESARYANIFKSYVLLMDLASDEMIETRATAIIIDIHDLVVPVLIEAGMIGFMAKMTLDICKMDPQKCAPLNG